MVQTGRIPVSPVRRRVAAISIGLVDQVVRDVGSNDVGHAGLTQLGLIQQRRPTGTPLLTFLKRYYLPCGVVVGVGVGVGGVGCVCGACVGTDGDATGTSTPTDIGARSVPPEEIKNLLTTMETRTKLPSKIIVAF